MKKKFVAFLFALLLLQVVFVMAEELDSTDSILADGTGDEDKTDSLDTSDSDSADGSSDSSTDADMSDADTTADSAAGSDGTRFDTCVSHLNDHGVRKAEAACKHIVEGKQTCARVLRRHDVKFPARICEKFGKQVVHDKITDHQFGVPPSDRERPTDKEFSITKRHDRKSGLVLEECVADGTSEDECKEKIAALRSEKREKIAEKHDFAMTKHRDRATAAFERCVADGGEEEVCKEKLADSLAHRRVISEEKREELKALHLAKKEEFEKARAAMKEKKEKLSLVREELVACKGDESADCEAKREEARKDAKAFLAETIASLMEHAEDLKARIASADTLSEEEVAAMEEKLSNYIDELNALSEKIGALSEDPTKEELEAIRKELKDKWHNLRHGFKVSQHRVVHHKVGNVVEKLEGLEDRLKHVLSKAADEGKDYSSLESKVEEFQAALDKAKTAHEAAKDAFSSDEDGSDHLAEAKDALKEAHGLLRTIVSELRGDDVSLDDASAEA